MYIYPYTEDCSKKRGPKLGIVKEAGSDIASIESIGFNIGTEFRERTAGFLTKPNREMCIFCPILRIPHDALQFFCKFFETI